MITTHDSTGYGLHNVKGENTMTLNDIIVSSLAQLGRGHDIQTLDAYRRKFTYYANIAQSEIAEALGIFRTDKLEAPLGRVNLGQLPRHCRKVIKVVQRGNSVPFRIGDRSDELFLPYDTAALITYNYEPSALKCAGDVSEIDEEFHGLIVSYIVGRERMSGDVSTQRGANLYLSMYESSKNKLRRHKGESDSYTIFNRY